MFTPLVPNKLHERVVEPLEPFKGDLYDQENQSKMSIFCNLSEKNIPQPKGNVNLKNLLEEPDLTIQSTIFSEEKTLEISEPQMILYSFYGAFENEFFESEEAVLNYLRNNGQPHTSICIIEYLGNFASHTDVIKRSFKNHNQIFDSKILSISSDDSYNEYDQQSSMRLGKHIWKRSYGTLRIIYSAFRNRGIVFENDIYAKTDEKNNQYTLTKKK